MANIFHPLEEFGDFPWDKLDTETARTEYDQGNVLVLCVAGDSWEIPENLAMLLSWHVTRGAEEAKSDMRDAIGIQE